MEVFTVTNNVIHMAVFLVRKRLFLPLMTYHSCCGLSYNRIHRSCTLYLLEHSFYLFPYKVLRNTCNSVLLVLGVRCVCALFTRVRCCCDCINL